VRPTKQAIIDAIVTEATASLFAGDNRDSEAPPLTLQNFYPETLRYGAKALRARLSRLSHAELLNELQASAAHVVSLQQFAEESFAGLERSDREARVQELSRQQAERGRKHGLQPLILAAARYYRGLGKTAKQAWYDIGQAPFMENAATVAIDKGSEKMHAWSQSKGQKRRGIGFKQWHSTYWSAAKTGKHSR
jgi:hypothetical protein